MGEINRITNQSSLSATEDSMIQERAKAVGMTVVDA